jgi:hypothetical protein
MQRMLELGFGLDRDPHLTGCKGFHIKQYLRGRGGMERHRSPATKSNGGPKQAVRNAWSDAWYTRFLPIRAPYPEYTLTGTSTLHTSRSSTTHFLCSWIIAIASPRHCAPIEYSHISFAARVGRATASQSGRVSDAIEHGTREKRSYTLRALRTSSK